MLAFVGCTLCLSIRDDLFDMGESLSADFGPPLVTRTFEPERFLELLRCFHLSDPFDRAPNDRIHRIRHLTDSISKQSMAVHPGQHLTVKDVRIGSNRRKKVEQRNPDQSADTGFNMLTLVDSATDYVFNFKRLQGGEGSDTAQSQRLVEDLVEPLEPQRWHVIGMAGSLSSASLFDSLLERGIYAVAITRSWSSHLLPSMALISKHLPEGQWLFRQRGELVCTSWMDRKPM